MNDGDYEAHPSTTEPHIVLPRPSQKLASPFSKGHRSLALISPQPHVDQAPASDQVCHILVSDSVREILEDKCVVVARAFSSGCFAPRVDIGFFSFRAHVVVCAALWWPAASLMVVVCPTVPAAHMGDASDYLWYWLSPRSLGLAETYGLRDWLGEQLPIVSRPGAACTCYVAILHWCAALYEDIERRWRNPSLK